MERELEMRWVEEKREEEGGGGGKVVIRGDSRVRKGVTWEGR